MTDDLLITVVLPTYNRAYLCARAVQSVVSQTDASWELIVVDDGSNDITRQLVNSFADSRIHYCWQSNAGVAAARNLGIGKARGQFVAFLDSDDEFLPNHLAMLKTAIKACDRAPGLYFTLPFVDDHGVLNDAVDHTSTPQTPILIGDNPETCCICIARDILARHLFDESIPIHEDAELWGRIARHYPVVKIPQRTVVIHLHSGPKMTASGLNQFLRMETVYRFIENTRHDRAPIPDSAFRKKWAEIYAGVTRNSWDRGSGFFLRYYLRTLAVTRGRAVVDMRINKALLKHLLFELRIIQS